MRMLGVVGLAFIFTITTEAKVEKWPLKVVRQIRVVGSDVKVDVSEKANATAIGVQLANEAEVKIDNGIVLITMPAGNSSEIKILGASRPVSVASQSAKISVHGWSSDLQLLANRGKIDVSRSKGRLKIGMNDGQVEMNNTQGRAELFLHNVNLKANEHSGDLDIENLLGASAVKAGKGKFSIISFNGSVEIAQSQGHVEFALKKSKLKVDDFNGDIRGVSNQGSVDIKLKTAANVHISAEQASVSIHSPQQSGAKINVGTQEGMIRTPLDAKPVDQGEWKVLTGKLPGVVEGNYYVRSEGGNISIK